MDYLEHRKASPRSLVFALVTVSDSRTVETDESGRIAEDILKSSGHEVCKRIIVRNDEGEIRRIIEELLSNGGIDVILTIGGTGLSRRDVTVETVSKTVEKRIEGFGELFRFLSYSEIGTAAMLTRAFAGVVKGKILICLPGSKNAVELAIRRLILPEIGHMVREARR
ncbi:MAG: molybdenum cofactor biosynthesis protein MoaB [Candidatus Brockarchaeota archaeon]|nr:molybdenum cofactor biosynthesis protein MoaB [Candidatus Brockarchaeota archaeon]MBO3808394.1 molybdenum cofactor biosynthesis protein MoaB [Candidatus Brockarchaeota archaeon]